MSHSHLESPSATGGGGKTQFTCQRFVSHVLPSAIIWTVLHNFKRDPALVSAAVISS